MTSRSPVVDSSIQRLDEFKHDRRFIDAERFCELLVSTRHLIRADDSAAGLRGLLEPTTGIRFMIEEQHLRNFSAYS